MWKSFFVVLSLMFFGVSCSLASGQHDYFLNNQKAISVVNWNVQTFFDAQMDGSEYGEFIKSKTWNETLYAERVKKLCQVLALLDSDVYVLEEIENESVIYDICNGLAEYKWNSGANWNYACFSKEAGSSIGCAVISKYELNNYTNHNMDVRINEKGQPSLRDIGKVELDVYGKKLILLVNHWKSKNTGEAETNFWRDRQESILANLLSEVATESEDCKVLICGDFNKDINEFEFTNDVSESNIVLRGMYPEMSVFVYSPWFDDNGNLNYNEGTYFYKDSWEKIDNFFVYGNLKILDFEICSNPLWTRENGIPYGFKIYTGEGYSDHLPIKILLQL